MRVLAYAAALLSFADARRCFSDRCKDTNIRYAVCEFEPSRITGQTTRERPYGIAIATQAAIGDPVTVQSEFWRGLDRDSNSDNSETYTIEVADITDGTSTISDSRRSYCTPSTAAAPVTAPTTTATTLGTFTDKNGAMAYAT